MITAFSIRKQTGHTTFPLLSSETMTQTHDFGRCGEFTLSTTCFSMGSARGHIAVGDSTIDIRDGAAFEIDDR
jgi:hypothetical protein